MHVVRLMDQFAWRFEAWTVALFEATLRKDLVKT